MLRLPEPVEVAVLPGLIGERLTLDSPSLTLLLLEPSASCLAFRMAEGNRP
jgi:hypothetical protein